MATEKLFVQFGRKFLIIFLALVVAIGMLGTVAFAGRDGGAGGDVCDTDGGAEMISAGLDSGLNSNISAPVTYTLIVNHVDENNQPLVAAELRTLAVGSDYFTAPRDDIDGYCYKETTGDVPVDIMDSDKTVTFIYGVTAEPDSIEDSDLFEIPDDDVPLADVPSTGDIAGLWMAISGLSAAGLIGLGVKRKKKDEE